MIKYRNKGLTVYKKKDRLSVNSADVQKIRHTTCQKETESRGSKETIYTKKIKIVRFLNILFVNMYFRDQKASSIISGSNTVIDIQRNCFFYNQL